MKKEIISLLISGSVVTSLSHAQEIFPDKVPAAVSNAFNGKFPGVTKTKWELEDSNYEASFNLNGEELSVNFDNEGMWLETETEISVSELPPVILTAIKNQFDNFKIIEASRVENFKYGSCYAAEIEKGKDTFELLLKPDGTVINKLIEKEDKGEKDQKDEKH